MVIKKYDNLPEEAKKIREEVFIKEQGFELEFDDIDNASTHLVLFMGDIASATCRIFYDDEKKSYIIGRIAVLKSQRKHGLGGEILARAEEIVKEKGADCLMLSAQLRAIEFYKKQGYEEFGDVFYDEYCKHIWMKKEL